MPGILYQLAPHIPGLISVQQSVILYAGLLLLLLSVIYIVFIYVARVQQNNLVLKQEAMQSAFQQQLLESKLEIQEQTFNAISQEIHDNVGQVLSLAKVQLNIIQESEYPDRTMLDQVKENISYALSDLRDIAGSLNSERIRCSSLCATIQKEIDRINRTGIMQVSLLPEGEEKEMNEQKKLILLRIIQECLQNCLKHSRAAAVTVQLQYEERSLKAVVRDNGQGFHVEAQETSKGLGLMNIRTRAALSGGSSSIESVPGQGTTITLNIPYA